MPHLSQRQRSTYLVNFLRQSGCEGLSPVPKMNHCSLLFHQYHAGCVLPRDWNLLWTCNEWGPLFGVPAVSPACYTTVGVSRLPLSKVQPLFASRLSWKARHLGMWAWFGHSSWWSFTPEVPDFDCFECNNGISRKFGFVSPQSYSDWTTNVVYETKLQLFDLG